MWSVSIDALKPAPGPAPALPAPARTWAAPWRPTQALWWGPSGLWSAHDPRQWPAAGSSPDRPAVQQHADFAAWCAQHRGERCRLALSAWWVIDLLADPALRLADDAAVLAHAGPLLQHYHGTQAAAWPLAAWHWGKRRGASALHGIDLAELLRTAQAHGVTVRGVHPWWAQALVLAQRGSSNGRHRWWLVESTLVTVAELLHGELLDLKQRRLEQASWPALNRLQAAWPGRQPIKVPAAEGADHKTARDSADHAAPHATGHAEHITEHTIGHGLPPQTAQDAVRLGSVAPPAALWHPPSATALRKAWGRRS